MPLGADGCHMTVPVDKVQDILEYIGQNTRNRIVFSNTVVDGLDFINVGRYVATELSKANNPLDIIANLLSELQFNPQIGNYIAIDNIGILFEPELKLDVKSILDSYSKNQTLIVRSDAVIADGKFYFLSPEDNISVSLDGLSFITINKRDNI